MVDRINRSSNNKSINAPSSAITTKKQKKPINEFISKSLLDEIITELVQEETQLSHTNVQNKIVLKTLTHSLSTKVSQEPKFKELFNFVNKELSNNIEAQSLIKEVLEKYIKNP